MPFSLFFFSYVDKSQFSENFFWNCEGARQQVRLSYGFQLHTQKGNTIRSIFAYYQQVLAADHLS